VQQGNKYYTHGGIQVMDDKQDLTNDPQELLKAKHKQDQHKTQFTKFAHNVSGNSPVDSGQVDPDQHHEPDQQNTMKSVENRMIGD
jgi:hypothetical protein